MTDISVITQDVLIITVTPPHGPAVVLDPIGKPGTSGADGDAGWTPVTALSSDGERRVLRIIDYVGGAGDKPTGNIGKYIGVSGLVVSISDAVDVRGAVGAQGQKGDQGDAGAVVIGEGTDILTGTGVPDDSLGIDNELYIDTVTGNLYKKLSGHWTFQAGLKGPKGDKGDKGDTGLQGPDGTPGVAGAAGAAGAKGDKGDTGNAGAAGADGAPGPTGKSIHVGTGAPASGLGNTSDSYVDQSNFNYYMKVNSTTWQNLGSLKGPAGTNGTDGADGVTIHTGSSVPSSGLGNDLDLYIRTTNGDVYLKTGGAWGSPIMNITGPQGATGAAGATGAKGDKGDTGSTGAAGTDGADGSVFLTGSGPPDGGDGNQGDIYIRNDTHHYYLKTLSNTWTDEGVLAGDVGATGPKGDKGDPGDNGDQGDPGAPGTNGSDGTDGATILTGSGAPSDASGVDGDFYIRSSNGDFYVKAGGHWGSPVGSLKGPDGATGATGSAGARGSVWSTGSSVPANSAPTGVLDGDFFLLSTNGEVYKHVAGAWADQGFTIKGADGSAGSTGAAGSAGARGSLWYTGSGAPTTGQPSGVANGDLYLRDNGEVYKYVAGAWVDQTINLTGPTGATGAPGSGGGSSNNKIMHYLFETSTTNSAPASGKFRFSIASFNGGSGGDDTWKVYINKTDNDGTDNSAFWTSGPSVVSQQFLGKKFMAADVSSFPVSSTTQPYIGKITAVTDHTGYVELTIEQITAPNGTNYAANQDCAIYILDMPTGSDKRGGILQTSAAAHGYGVPSLRIGGVSAYTFSASTMLVVPFDLDAPAFINSICWDVTTAATAGTGTVRPFIYRRQRNYNTGTITGGALIKDGGAQTNNLASTGHKEVNVFQEMTPGQYFLCLAISTFSGSPVLNGLKCQLPEASMMDFSFSGTTISRAQLITCSGDKTGSAGSTMPAITIQSVAVPTSGNDGFQFLAPVYMKWSRTD